MNLVALFMANFPKRPFVHTRRHVATKRAREIITRRGVEREGREMECTRREGGGGESFHSWRLVEKKGRLCWRVFAVIIIAGFLPRMLRKQQVAALARVARTRGQIVQDNDESQSKPGD